MKELLEMDDMFLPFDHTKQQDVIVSTEEIGERRGSLTPGSLLRRVGSVIEQNRYKSKGYHELAEEEPTTTTTLSTTSSITTIAAA